MSAIPAGPFESFTFKNGATAPWYLVPFDKDGNCIGPETSKHLIDAAAKGDFTDIHVFSHGWNNVFQDAVGLYREFWKGYFDLRDLLNLNDPSQYRPLVVGILWPSTALVGDDEETPAFAGGEDSTSADLKALASDLSSENADRVRALADLSELTREQALELAELLLPIYDRPEPDGFAASEASSSSAPLTPEELVNVWSKSQGESKFADVSGEIKPLPDDDMAPASGPAAAGLFDFLNPKKIVRVATVYQMKDRAGRVGATGVRKLITDLLNACAAPVHLLGHSYGCRVMLSAVSAQPLPRMIRSMTLLQPAVNYLCFAADANGQGRPGGYRPALDRVERPIFTTFSRKDFPLNKTFHFACRRDRDLGEAIIAAPEVAPSRFAALGGYGPGGLEPTEVKVLDILKQPQKYPASPGTKIFALNGSADRINGHGDVRNEFTVWAHLNLVSPDRL